MAARSTDVPIPVRGDRAGLDRRRSERVDVRVTATVHLAGPPRRGTLRADVLDLSDDGCCVRAPAVLPVGTPVEVDLECQVPVRVRLGFDPDALVVDGPMHTHLVSIAGRVVRVDPTSGRNGWRIGIALNVEGTRQDELETMCSYVDFLHEQIGIATW